MAKMVKEHQDEPERHGDTLHLDGEDGQVDEQTGAGLVWDAWDHRDGDTQGWS